MDDLIPEQTAGPGKLRVFMILITGLVLMLVFGTILSLFYNIHWVENIAKALANRPMLVFEIAGVISLGILFVKAASYLDNQDSF
ncbi:MAG: hypothetical protein ABEH81_03125 [Halopenitus sp.]